MPIKQRGRIVVEGKEAIIFWIRAFQLEDTVDKVHQELVAEADPKTRANLAIASEHRLSPELIWIYLVCPIIDMIGVCDGTAVVYFASPEFEKEATRERDKFTRYSMKEAERQGKLKAIGIMRPSKET